MTCIVGLQKDGKVYIGGDSAGLSGYSLMQRSDPKVFQNGEMIFGITTSFRMGQLLRYHLVVPECDTEDIEKYMCTKFIRAVKNVFLDDGFSTLNDRNSGGEFLVGFKGRLWKIESDFQVSWNPHGYDAIGCGRDIALGSMYTQWLLDRDSPEGSIRIALCASSVFSAGVLPPWVVLSN